MTDPDLHQNIISSVKEGFAEQIEFTKALVRFESTRGAEHAIQDFVFRSLKEEGFALERFNMVGPQLSGIRAVPSTPTTTRKLPLWWAFTGRRQK
jgi:acetylornithine deacetylase/succinyl-diaminopimelate desuccinylase-like protein